MRQAEATQPARLRISVVGIFACVLSPDGDPAKAKLARILVPTTDDHQMSRAAEHVMIPPHQGFVAIPRELIDGNPPKGYALITSFPLPYIPKCDSSRPQPQEFVVYELNGDVVRIVCQTDDPFKPVYRGLSDCDVPSCGNADDLHWLADMRRYSGSSSQVRDELLTPRLPPSGASYIDVTHGTLRVSSLEAKHTYRFANAKKKYHQPLADALTAESSLKSDRVTVRIEGSGRTISIVVRGPKIDIMIGSASYDILAHEPPKYESCGVPDFHHEMLYIFSKEQPTKPCVPVCTNDHGEGKNPIVGHCIPGGRMTGTVMTGTPSTTAAQIRQRADMQPAKGLSLHLGLNVYSPSFYNDNNFEALQLESAVNDAQTTDDLAKHASFTPCILVDGQATRDAVSAEIAKAAADLSQTGGCFILSFSGEGMPEGDEGGWCLYDHPVPFQTIRDWLTPFGPAVRVLVISDSCHSGQGDAGETGSPAKQLSLRRVAGLRQNHPDAFAVFERAAQRRRERSLDSTPKPTMYFLAACGPNETTDDGDRHGNSPFTDALKSSIERVTPLTFDELVELLIDRLPDQTPELRREPRDKEFDEIGPFNLTCPRPN